MSTRFHRHVSLRRLALSVAAGLCVLALAACGGSAHGDSGGGGVVVARVGDVPITRAAVSHWMRTLAGQDYLGLSHGHVLPEGIVSDPPQYTTCVTHLEATNEHSPKPLTLPATVMLRKCREIYQALRTQAIAQLVRAQWLTQVAQDQGIQVSPGEVVALYNRRSSEQYPHPTELQAHLANARTSRADELLVAKELLLAQKATTKLHAAGKQGTAAFADAEQRWSAKTSCDPGYVVPYCKQYDPSRTPQPNPSATILMEQVATLATGHCINTAACSKQ